MDILDAHYRRNSPETNVSESERVDGIKVGGYISEAQTNSFDGS